MGMAKFELPPFGMTQRLPTLWVCGKFYNIVPCDRLIRPSKSFGHRAPHGKADGRINGLYTGIRDEQNAVSITPDTVGFIHPGLIARAPDHGCTLSVQNGYL